MAPWKTEAYRGFILEAFPALLGWEISGLKEGKLVFAFSTPADDAEGCLRWGRNSVDERLDAKPRPRTRPTWAQKNRSSRLVAR